MKKESFKSLATMLALCLMLCSCAGNKEISGEKADVKLDGYPLKGDVELTYWLPLNANVAATATNFGETSYAKELIKKTGVKVKYIHPAMGQEGEAFSLMIASNELSDIVEYDWLGSLGGPSSAVNDKVIVSLNDLLQKYAPNLSSYLQENQDVDKMVKTDDCQYYVFPFLKGDKSLLLSGGPIVRKDWLDELGIQPPETIAEWESMLLRFKNEKGAEAPFTIVKSNKAMLISMMNANYSFYIDNGKVKFGPIEPEFRFAINTLNKWFNMRILDKNYSMVDNVIQDSNMLNGKSGATYGSGGGGLGKWLDTMKNKDATYQLTGVRYPIVNKGDKQRFVPIGMSYCSWSSAAITTACKNPEVAAKFLDYSYSKEGHMLNNFGIEGESYNIVDGYPEYTDIIMNNPDKLTVSQAMGKYNRANYSGPFIQDKRYLEQYYSKPVQQESLAAWLTDVDESEKTRMPAITLTTQESEEYTNIITEINKYRDEMSTAFISGTKPLSDYDTYISTIEKLGLKRAIEIQQAGYERCINR